jgi:hypothetical protein
MPLLNATSRFPIAGPNLPSRKRSDLAALPLGWDGPTPQRSITESRKGELSTGRVNCIGSRQEFDLPEVRTGVRGAPKAEPVRDRGTTDAPASGHAGTREDLGRENLDHTPACSSGPRMPASKLWRFDETLHSTDPLRTRRAPNAPASARAAKTDTTGPAQEQINDNYSYHPAKISVSTRRRLQSAT